MARQNYTAKMPWGETLIVSADLSQAAAPICIVDPHGHPVDGDDDGECSTPTPYQTADARHGEKAAVRLAIDYCGREWYAQPGDRRPSDEILDEIMEHVTIR